MKYLLAILLFLSLPLYALDWGDPVMLSSSTTLEGKHPDAAVDSTGNRFVVWREDGVPNKVIRLSILQVNQNDWFLMPDVTDPTMEDAVDPAIAIAGVPVNNMGTAIIVWRDKTAMEVKTVTYTYPIGDPTNGTFSNETTLSLSNNNITAESVHAVSSSSDIIAGWIQISAGMIASPTVYAATYSGGMWSTAQPLSDPATTTANFLSLAMNPSGQAAAMWDSGGAGAYAAMYDGSWSLPATQIFVSTDQIFSPNIALDSLGNAAAVWFDNNTVSVAAALFPVGTAWSSPQTLSVDAAFSPTVAFLMDDNAVAAWSESDGSNFPVRTATAILPSTTWTSPTPITPAGQDYFPVDMASNGDGILVLGLDAGSSNDAAAVMSFESNAWSTPQIFNPSLGVERMSVAINGNQAVIAWEQDNVTETYIEASTRTFGPNPPTNGNGAQILNRFPAESEYFNQLFWEASTTLEVVSYQIKRNGTLIATIPASQLSYRDHDQQKGVSVTYTVTAIDSNGNPSSALTITVS